MSDEFEQKFLENLGIKPAFPEEQPVDPESTSPEQPATPESTEPPASGSVEPPVEEPAKPVATEVNWEELTGGTFKSKDEFSQGISNFNRISAELTKYRTLDTSGIFANDKLKKLNSFTKKTGIDDLGVFERVSAVSDVASLSDAEAIALAKIVDHPELNSRYNDLVLDVKHKYGIEKEKFLEDDENYTPRFNDIDLVTDRASANKKLSEFLAKVNAEDQGAEQADIQSYVARREAWAKAPELLSSQKYNLELPDGENGKLGYEIPQEDVLVAAREVSRLFADAGFEPSKENLQAFAGLFEQVALGYAAKSGKLSTIFRGKYMAEAQEKADGKFHNPDPIETERRPQGGVHQKTLQDENFQKAMEQLG